MKIWKITLTLLMSLIMTSSAYSAPGRQAQTCYELYKNEYKFTRNMAILGSFFPIPVLSTIFSGMVVSLLIKVMLAIKAV